MQQVLTVEVGKPEKDVGIIKNPSKNIKERVRGNHDSSPTSGMSRKGIVGCWFWEEDGFEGVAHW